MLSVLRDKSMKGHSLRGEASRSPEWLRVASSQLPFLLGKFEEQQTISKNWEITLDLASSSPRVDGQCGFIK